MAENYELIPKQELNPATLFASDNGDLEKVLEHIEKLAKAHVPVLDTDADRKAIASMAHKVARSKTFLDDMGKDLVADKKNEIKIVDNARKTVRDRLDELKAEVRKPLDDWEAAEAQRKEAEAKAEQERIQARIDALAAVGCEMPFFEVAGWDDAKFKEVLGVATDRHNAEQAKIAEEARLKAEAEERERLEREAEAKRLAEQKAEQDRIAAEQKAKQDEIDAKLKALAEAEAEAERKEREATEKRIIERTTALVSVNHLLPAAEVKAMSDDEFAAVLESATKAHEKRKAEIEAEMKAKAEAEAARAEIEAVKKARFEMLAAVGYTYPLDDLGIMSDFQWTEMYEAHKKAWEKKEQEKWLADMEAKHKREAAEQAEAERLAAEEAARLEALMPDKERAVFWAREIKAALEAGPTIKDSFIQKKVSSLSLSLSESIEFFIKDMEAL